MDNQACRKRDLELWQVLEPSKPRTARRQTGTRSSQGRQGSQSRQGSQGRAPVRNGTNVQIVTLVPDKTVQNRNRARANAKALKRRRAKQRGLWIFRCVTVTLLLMLCVTLFSAIRLFYQEMRGDLNVGQGALGAAAQDVFGEKDSDDGKTGKPEIVEDFLSISEYNRPGTKLSGVKNIFVHYTANPKTSAAQNRSYFESLSQTHERAASAHFIIGCEGEIIQCIPLDEEAYAVRGRNNDSISIECCYVNADGSFEQATYDTLIHTLAWLVQEYDLDAEDILRHYDSCEKLCPIYYVEHEDAWERLIADVKKYGKSVDTQTTL